MPLPAILGALARLAGPALARVGARGAAGAAAEGAIGTASQQAGRAAAGQAGGFVLDSTKLTNARGITAALGGKVPAAATAAPATAAPGATPATAATAPMPSMPAPAPASAPASPRAPWKGAPKPAPTVPDAASAPTPAPAPTAPPAKIAGQPQQRATAVPSPPIIPKPTVPGAASAPASNPAAPAGKAPKGDSWASKVGKKFTDIKNKVVDTASKAMQKHVPDVADQTKGLTWDQRYERLQKAGRLLHPHEYARSLGTENPSRQQVTEKSEEHEQKANDKFNESSGQVGRIAGAFKKALTNPIGAITLLYTAFGAATKAATSYAEGQVEAGRSLARFNGQIANAVARFDLADLKRNVKFAGATSGSSRQLIDTLSKFKDDFQPVKVLMTKSFNKMAITVIKAASVVIALHYPLIRAAEGIVDWLIGEEGKANPHEGTFRTEVKKFLEAHNKKVGETGRK